MFQVACQNNENFSRNPYFQVSRCQDFIYHIVHFKKKLFKSISVYILCMILIRSLFNRGYRIM